MQRLTQIADGLAQDPPTRQGTHEPSSYADAQAVIDNALDSRSTCAAECQGTVRGLRRDIPDTYRQDMRTETSSKSTSRATRSGGGQNAGNGSFARRRQFARELDSSAGYRTAGNNFDHRAEEFDHLDGVQRRTAFSDFDHRAEDGQNDGWDAVQRQIAALRLMWLCSAAGTEGCMPGNCDENVRLMLGKRDHDVGSSENLQGWRQGLAHDNHDTNGREAGSWSVNGHDDALCIENTAWLIDSFQDSDGMGTCLHSAEVYEDYGGHVSWTDRLQDGVIGRFALSLEDTHIAGTDSDRDDDRAWMDGLVDCIHGYGGLGFRGTQTSVSMHSRQQTGSAVLFDQYKSTKEKKPRVQRPEMVRVESSSSDSDSDRAQNEPTASSKTPAVPRKGTSPGRVYNHRDRVRDPGSGARRNRRANGNSHREHGERPGDGSRESPPGMCVSAPHREHGERCATSSLQLVLPAGRWELFAGKSDGAGSNDRGCEQTCGGKSGQIQSEAEMCQEMSQVCFLRVCVCVCVVHAYRASIKYYIYIHIRIYIHTYTHV